MKQNINFRSDIKSGTRFCFILRRSPGDRYVTAVEISRQRVHCNLAAILIIYKHREISDRPR